MQLRGRKVWILLGLLLPLICFCAYQGSYCVAGAYHRRTAREALARRDFAAASEQLERSLAAWPNNVETYLLAAQTERRRGHFEDAERHLSIYLQRKDAKHAREAQAEEAKLFALQTGDLRGADVQLGNCLDHPDAPAVPLVIEALIEGSLKSLLPASKLGLTASDGPAAPDLARTRRAIDFWLRQFPAHADQVQGLVWRGRFEEIAGDHAAEVADYRAALAMDPNHFEARWQLALAVVHEHPEESASHLETLEQSHPDNQQVRLVLAGVRRSLGRLAEARTALDALLKADPNNVSALLERGRLAVDTLELADAEELLRRAEKLQPNHPDINLTLSRCLHLRGQLSEAKHFQDRFEQINAELEQNRAQLIQRSKSVRKG